SDLEKLNIQIRFAIDACGRKVVCQDYPPYAWPVARSTELAPERSIGGHRIRIASDNHAKLPCDTAEQFRFIRLLPLPEKPDQGVKHPFPRVKGTSPSWQRQQ